MDKHDFESLHNDQVCEGFLREGEAVARTYSETPIGCRLASTGTDPNGSHLGALS
jgi:hypothetical protein